MTWVYVPALPSPSASSSPEGEEGSSAPATLAGTWWEREPDGIPRTTPVRKDRIGRLKLTGNGQVPLVMATAFRRLLARAFRFQGEAP